MAQLFANAARGELASALTDAATTLTLSSPAGTLFPVANRGTGSTGDWFRIVVQDATYYEVMLVRTHTSGANTFSNVLRGQEGTTARAFAAGSTVGLRVTAADAAGWGLPDGGTTDDFLDGGRAWSSLATKVRGAALTGLSVLSTAAITATDSVLSAFGKLQAQLNSHLNLGGGVHPNATTSESGFMSSADKTKLNGIAASAAALGDVVALDLGTASAGSGSTAARIDHRHKLPTKAELGIGNVDNVSAANLRDRATHTGTQAQNTVTNLTTDLAARVNRQDSYATVTSGVINLGLETELYHITVSGNVTVSVSNAPSVTRVVKRLIVQYSSGVVTWPASFKLPTPMPTFAAGKAYVFSIEQSPNSGVYFLVPGPEYSYP